MRIAKKITLSILIITASLLGCACINSQSSENHNTTSTVSATKESATQAQTTEITTVQVTTQKPTEKVTKKATEKAEEKTAECEKKVVLNNEYTTRYQEVNQVTYPPFVFNYPDNWSITKEECNNQLELVTIENGKGASVTFLHCSDKLEGGGSGVNMARVDISKEAPSQFIPGSIQATDYSDLGEFMVAKLKTTGILNMKTDSEYTDVDGDISYAVLPLSEHGTRENVRKATSGEFTFWYAGDVSFTGMDTEDDFTDEEQQEIIAILNSFRVEQY